MGTILCPQVLGTIGCRVVFWITVLDPSQFTASNGASDIYDTTSATSHSEFETATYVLRRRSRGRTSSVDKPRAGRSVCRYLRWSMDDLTRQALDRLTFQTPLGSLSIHCTVRRLHLTHSDFLLATRTLAVGDVVSGTSEIRHDGLRGELCQCSMAIYRDKMTSRVE